MFSKFLFLAVKFLSGLQKLASDFWDARRTRARRGQLLAVVLRACGEERQWRRINNFRPSSEHARNASLPHPARGRGFLLLLLLAATHGCLPSALLSVLAKDVGNLPRFGFDQVRIFRASNSKLDKNWIKVRPIRACAEIGSELTTPDGRGAVFVKCIFLLFNVNN